MTGQDSRLSLIERCPCRQCRHHGKTWEQIAVEDDERTLPARRKMKERALTAENQLRGAVSLLDDLSDVLADVRAGVVPADGSIVRDVLERAVNHVNGGQ